MAVYVEAMRRRDTQSYAPLRQPISPCIRYPEGMAGRQHAWMVAVPVLAVAVAGVVLFAALYQPSGPAPDALYQVTPFNVFSSGRYDGNTTFADLAGHGNFGIGTLNGLDGEMVALDGRFFQVCTDGVPREVGPSNMTPYATVTFFNEDAALQISQASNLSQLCSLIDVMMPDDEGIYAIRVMGVFDHVQGRSVPKQEKPYPPLQDAVKNQTVFELDVVEATLVGFFFPESMDGVDYVGYHFHFLTSDLSGGGHLLDCSIVSGFVSLDRIYEYQLALD